MTSIFFIDLKTLSPFRLNLKGVPKPVGKYTNFNLPKPNYKKFNYIEKLTFEQYITTFEYVNAHHKDGVKRCFECLNCEGKFNTCECFYCKKALAIYSDNLFRFLKK